MKFRYVVPLLVICLFTYLSCAKNSDASISGNSLVGDAEKDIFNETGYPIVTEPITAEIIVYKRPFNPDLNTMPLFDELSEKSGIDIHFNAIPGASWTEKIGLLIAGGELKDMVWGRRMNTGQYGPEGMYLNLDPYIEKYIPRLKSLIDSNPKYQRAIKANDGHVYYFPTIEELLHRTNPDNLFINKVWLDKLGLPVPKTTEELYQTLKAFKEQDPNGNGKADEIPFSPQGLGFMGINSLFGSFGYPRSLGNKLVVEDGKVVFVPANSGYRDAIIYFQKLYNENLLDKETFTQAGSEMMAKGKAAPPILGMFFAWFDENEVGPENVGNYTVVPPLFGPDGQRPKWNNSAYNTISLDGVVLPATTRYPASLSRLLNLTYQPEWSWQIGYGLFGKQLHKDADGNVALQNPKKGLSQAEWRYQDALGGDNTPIAITAEMFAKFIGPPTMKRKDERYEVYKPFMLKDEEVYPPVQVALDENAELSTLNTDLNDFVDQSTVDWITSPNADVMQEWDAYLERLDNVGLARALEIYQAAYDRYISN